MGISFDFSYKRYDNGISNASTILIKFSNDMALLPCSICLIESIERSAASANWTCVKFLCFWYILMLSAIIYLISFLHLFSILIYLFWNEEPNGGLGYSPGHDVTYFDRHKKRIHYVRMHPFICILFPSWFFIESGNLLIPYAANIKICNLPLSYVA